MWFLPRAGVGLALGVATAMASVTPTAQAAKVPLSFDPKLGANPTGTQQKLAALQAKLPSSFALPSTLQSLTSGKVQLLFFPETAKALQDAQKSGPGPMTWPAPAAWCKSHDSFAAPTTLLAAGAAGSCAGAETSIRQKLAEATGVCAETAQPERYVLSYAPAVVNEQTTGSIEALIGLAGEALSHHQVPAGLLPADWVPTLRSVLWKIRRAPITGRVALARSRYTEVTSALGAQPTCFETSARTALTASVAALDAELAAISAELDKREADGKTNADQELICLAARQRSRVALPFPTLSAHERRFIAFWLGGVYWRMRGGGAMQLGSTQAARHFFLENPFRRIGELAGGSTGNEAGFRVFLNITNGWGEWMDMGTTPGGQDLYEDLVQMTDRGRLQVADPPLGSSSAAAYLGEHDYDATDLLTGGLEMGPCYAYGLDPLQGFRFGATAAAPYSPFIEGFTALGEFCTGASMALGMTKSLLEGIPSGKPKVDLCSGRTCGDDGCGGTCGTCPGGQTCSAESTCVSCVPSCAGKTCGSDGCGGSCGECAKDPDAAPAAGAAPSPAGDGAGCHTSRGTSPGSFVVPALVALLLASAASRRRRPR